MHTSADVVSFLFTDIERSSELWELDPVRMSVAMAKHDQMLRRAVELNRGKVVKMTGDGMHAAFNDPLGGLNTAFAIQEAVMDPRATNDVQLRIRCGLHVGVVERRDNDFFGRAVNRAARIMSIAHGGQVLLSQAIVELVRDRLPPDMSVDDRGSVWLRDMISPEHIYQLTHPRLPAKFPPLRTAEPTKTNLPVPQSSFVGRGEELQQVKELLRTHRLVSIVGSGGIGKTRVALQTAMDLRAQFADGTWFVDLAPLAAAGQVAEMVSSIFPAAESGPSSATEAVLTSLRQKQLLLILDNCEHVLQGVTELVPAILKNCKDITMLVTSRETLSVHGEFAWRIQPLTFPEHAQEITADQAMQYGAVRLFAERAEAALGRFVMTDAIAPVVSEICKRLDGIALAIELAVPRLKILKPDELLARLKERFRLLTGGDRTARPRQQTLLAAIDWSYRLLNEHEQAFLMRLGTFPDTFTLDSAQAVCARPPIDVPDVLDLMAALTDKSLIVPAGTTIGASRYKLLESTRQFSLERLRESGDTSGLRRLADYLIHEYGEAELQWDTTPDTRWYDTYEPDLENVRATLAWAFGPEGDALLGIGLVAHTRHLVQWWRRPERQRWFEAAGARLNDQVPAPLVGRVKLGIASSVGAHVGQRQGLAEAVEAAAIFKRLGDRKNHAWALTIAADTIIRLGDMAAADAYYEEAEALMRSAGPTKQLASVLASKAVARGFLMGDTASARALFAESLAIARSVGYRRLIDTTAIHMAEIEAVEGRFDAAIARAREAEAASRQSGNERFLNVTLANLTGYLLAVGQLDAARGVGAEAMRLARSHGDSFVVNALVERLALAAALSGDVTRAARLAGYCSATFHADRTAREFLEQRTWQSLMNGIDGALAVTEKAALMAEGAVWDENRAANAAVEH